MFVFLEQWKLHVPIIIPEINPKILRPISENQKVSRKIIWKLALGYLFVLLGTFSFYYLDQLTLDRDYTLCNYRDTRYMLPNIGSWSANSISSSSHPRISWRSKGWESVNSSIIFRRTTLYDFDIFVFWSAAYENPRVTNKAEDLSRNVETYFLFSFMKEEDDQQLK